MRAALSCLIFMAPLLIWAQNPGGVTGHVSWVKPLAVQNTRSIEINYNAIDPYDNTQDTMVFSSQSSLLEGLTFFCVSMCDTTREQALWSMGNDSAIQVVMTNRRMAGLDEFKYINFQNRPSAIPQISTYYRKRASTDTVTGKTLVHIGTMAKDQVPVSDFKGALPEFVLYNRVLSFQERMRVESYLAIKYGISLSQTYPTSYLNGKGEIIWDAQKFGSYAGSIAGLGRDDLSGLMQLKSGSSETPQMLEMAASELEDQDFLIWGDNQQPLTMVRNRGEIPRLQRGWVAAVTGNFIDKQTTVTFTDTYLEEMYPLEDDEIFWLAIDDSGDGTYPTGQSRYYANQSKITGTQKFEEITWDENGSGYDYFTLIAAPRMFAAVNMVPPICSTNQPGGLTAEMVGGEAPYQVQLLKEGELVAQGNGDQRIFFFSELEQGNYQLLVSDQQNRTYKQAFLLANADMDQVTTFDAVSLKSGSSLILDGSTGMNSPSDYYFQWQKPNGECDYTPCLSVEEAGVYLLSVTNGLGCSTLREAEVRLLPDEFLKHVQVSPNPTVQGQATLKVQLVQEGAITVTITSPAGRVESKEQFSGSNYYLMTCHFPDKGMWLVTVYGGGERKTVKVMRER